MLKNYLKIAIRNLLKHKAFSFINLLGLAIGMASAILIFAWIYSEAGTDRFYHNTDRIYALHSRATISGVLGTGEQTPNPLAAALRTDYPEVEQVSRFTNITFLLTVGDKHINTRGAFTDSSYLSIFDFPLQAGTVAASLNQPDAIVLTQGLAQKLFGNEDPMGKIVRIDSNANFKVTAVLRDLPANTAFAFEYLLPWQYMQRLGWENDNWTNNFTSTYVLLKPGTTQAAFDAKIKSIVIDHSRTESMPSKTEVFTQPISRAYLYGKSENGQLVAGKVVIVRLFAAIACFILLIACINFMNLSTARSERRAREVGIRKVSGAQRSSLIFQFIGESICLSAIAFIMALLIVRLSLPFFNKLVGKELLLPYSSPIYWLIALGFVLLTGLIAGSYPALYLSSFSPVSVLKGAFRKTNALVTPRKVLVVLQFTFAIILIISTIIVRYQIEYVQNRDAGYKKDGLVFTFAQGDADKFYPVIRQELLSSGAAVSVTRTANPITKRWGSGYGYQWNGSTADDERVEFVQMGADANFVKTMGLSLLEGRDIDIYSHPDDSLAVLLNESAVRDMRLSNPVGQIIRRKGYTEQWHVVGVVRDFILESPFQSHINPTIITGPGYFFQVLHFKLNPANQVSDNLARAGAIFKKYNPQYPFEYVFVDEAYARKFEDARRTGQLALLFAGLTIFISCLGLFALSAYMVENRIKEIGVRKILGAGIGNITLLLSTDFLKLVLIAFFIASPIAWYAMQGWLKDYTYRIDFSWWIFAGAGILSMLIATLTISIQTIRAALANPVNSLRKE